MKTSLIASVAIVFGLTASLPALAFSKAPDIPNMVTDDAGNLLLDLARRGRGADDAPGDDRGGRGRGTDDGPNHASNTGTGEAVILLARRGSDDGPNDDHGGRGHGSDDASGDDRGRSGMGSADDNDTVKTSGRRKPRIKGGSGCDDAGDAAEHPECR